jgi:hypothetical protein
LVTFRGKESGRVGSDEGRSDKKEKGVAENAEAATP